MPERPASPYTLGQWMAQNPSNFVDRRVQLRRDERGGLVRYGVQAWRANIVRKGPNGKPEYDHCPHAHNKMSAARKCAEAAAKRLNRANRKEALDARSHSAVGEAPNSQGPGAPTGH